MRLGEEFRDLDDVRYLLRYLNLDTADEGPPQGLHGSPACREHDLPPRSRDVPVRVV